MQIGFLLPNEMERVRIAGFRKKMEALTPDQQEHCAHLLRSWRVFNSRAGLAMVGRAISRTLSDRP